MGSAEYREQLRHSPWLLWSLLTVLRASVPQHCTDLKSVEHCACSLRNLSYALHNNPALVDDSSEKKHEEPNPKTKSAVSRIRFRSSSQQSKQVSTEEGKLRRCDCFYLACLRGCNAIRICLHSFKFADYR